MVLVFINDIGTENESKGIKKVKLVAFLNLKKFWRNP